MIPDPDDVVICDECCEPIMCDEAEEYFDEELRMMVEVCEDCYSYLAERDRATFEAERLYMYADFKRKEMKEER